MRERLLSKLSEARDSVKLVRENLPENFEKFRFLSKLERDGIYKNIEFAIQNILDICAIILKKEDMSVPASDEDMLEEIERSKILDKKAVKTTKEMKRFRNYLVNRYGKLDDKAVYKNIKSGLKDFENIFDNFENYISNKK